MLIVGGIYMAFKKFRKDINFDEVIGIFIITSFLRIFDVLTTISFASRLGTNYEWNSFPRFMMQFFGIVPTRIYCYTSCMVLYVSYIKSIS